MGCHGGFNLDEATRRSWYNPDIILNVVQAGMIFVDVGCGDGFFSILAARKVGSTGRVFAVDIDTQAIQQLQNKAEAEGLQNITAKAATAEDAVFCQGCADIIFFSMDLHDFRDTAKVLKNARQMIKSQGLLIDLDWKKITLPLGPPLAIKFSEQHVANLLRSAGFTVAQMSDAGPYHYIVTATPRLP